MQQTDLFSMVMDVLCVSASSVLSCAFILHRGSAGISRTITLHEHHIWIPIVLILGYALSVVFNCQRLHLYTPERYTSIIQEQRHILQACLMSGLLLVGTLYLLHPKDPRTGIVVLAVSLTTLTLSARRMISRLLLYRSLRNGTAAGNVFVVGTGPPARALRNHLDNMRHLGYAFKGFIETSHRNNNVVDPDVVGTLESLFEHVRRDFIDEVFFATPCDRNDVQQVLQNARYHNVNIRLVPDLYDSSILNPTVEYLGNFPTIPLCCRRMPESRLFMKRALDITISAVALLGLLPLLLVIAIIIKLGSSGPVFYVSDRIGRKGRTFRCIKFRTMVENAESLRLGLAAWNQRDGVLFKIDNDPRITHVGRFLRKYSLDELPQFINVLLGDMSVVGPRPPLAGEVKQYKAGHLRRLDMTPGITGLWQVQARKDPSFDKYVSLDMSYIENWSIRLDFEIMLRTIGVIIAGTGS